MLFRTSQMAPFSTPSRCSVGSRGPAAGVVVLGLPLLHLQDGDGGPSLTSCQALAVHLYPRTV